MPQVLFGSCMQTRPRMGPGRRAPALSPAACLQPQCNLKQVARADENQELFGAVDLRGAHLDFQASRDSLHRLQEAQDPGRAAFSLGSPLYLNLFPVRPRSLPLPCLILSACR